MNETDLTEKLFALKGARLASNLDHFNRVMDKFYKHNLAMYSENDKANSGQARVISKNGSMLNSVPLNLKRHLSENSESRKPQNQENSIISP